MALFFRTKIHLYRPVLAIYQSPVGIGKSAVGMTRIMLSMISEGLAMSAAWKLLGMSATLLLPKADLERKCPSSLPHLCPR
jgi:hypothetical protein